MTAVLTSDVVVLGPGSWFTSVIPHLLLPDLGAALSATPARVVVTLNLVPQAGETDEFSPAEHLRVLRQYRPDLRLDVVVADEDAVDDHRALRSRAASPRCCGACPTGVVLRSRMRPRPA